MTGHRLDGPVPQEGRPVAVRVAGRVLVLARVDGVVHAVDDACTHLGCSLAEGELDGVSLACPCHFSTFDVTTGAVLSGPATVALRSYPVVADDDGLRVELPG